MSKLTILLDEYIEGHYDGDSFQTFLDRIDAYLVTENRGEVYEQIGSELWGKYSVIDIEVGISILRRWLAVEPDSVEAKRNLGAYLHFHGPDWDEEAKKLIEEVNQAWELLPPKPDQDAGPECSAIL